MRVWITYDPTFAPRKFFSYGASERRKFVRVGYFCASVKFYAPLDSKARTDLAQAKKE